jgi:hypothetical protein
LAHHGYSLRRINRVSYQSAADIAADDIAAQAAQFHFAVASDRRRSARAGSLPM